VQLSESQRERLDQVSAPTLNFPAENNARFGPMLAFGGMTVDGVAHPARSIAA
jgi:hypothetical protein